MARRQVRRGPRAGLEMWGCERWPECNGAINIDPESSARGAGTGESPVRSGEPAGYAQAIFERARTRDRLRRRAALPLIVSMAVIFMTAIWFAAQPLGQIIAGIGVVGVAAGFAFALIRLPFDSLFWARGIQGEQRAAEYIAPLLNRGYVVLYNRFVPGAKGDIDSLVVGPTGVFVIETKNWSKKLEVRDGRLWVDGHERTQVLRDLHQRSLAVQIALSDALTAERATVIPIVCAVGGIGLREPTAGGVQLTDAKGLARLIERRPSVFNAETVQRIARIADERMRAPFEWERK